VLDKELKPCREAYDAHDHNINQRDADSSNPFQFSCHGPSLDDDSNTVDDDLQ
jgi:hypothetical protein